MYVSAGRENPTGFFVSGFSVSSDLAGLAAAHLERARLAPMVLVAGVIEYKGGAASVLVERVELLRVRSLGGETMPRTSQVTAVAGV